VNRCGRTLVRPYTTCNLEGRRADDRAFRASGGQYPAVLWVNRRGRTLVRPYTICNLEGQRVLPRFRSSDYLPEVQPGVALGGSQGISLRIAHRLEPVLGCGLAGALVP
jgi:hypothetical protein